MNKSHQIELLQWFTELERNCINMFYRELRLNAGAEIIIQPKLINCEYTCKLGTKCLQHVDGTATFHTLRVEYSINQEHLTGLVLTFQFHYPINLKHETILSKSLVLVLPYLGPNERQLQW